MRNALLIFVLVGACIAQAHVGPTQTEALSVRLHAAFVTFDQSISHRGVTPEERAAAVAKYEAALKPILADVRAYRKSILPNSTADEDKKWDAKFAEESPIEQANGLERYLRKLEARK